MSVNQCDYCDALCYYLEHLNVDLAHNRMELLRDYADPLCAMVNGYVSGKDKVTGDHNKYKTSCFASKSALVILQNKKWKTRGANLRLEHAIPITEIGKIILSKKQQLTTSVQVLNLLNKLLIPCVITKNESEVLDRYFKNSMPKNSTKSWDRYRQTPLQPSNPKGAVLFNEIVALRPGLQNSSGIPLSQTITPYQAQQAHQCTCKCGSLISTSPIDSTNEYEFDL